MGYGPPRTALRHYVRAALLALCAAWVIVGLVLLVIGCGGSPLAGPTRLANSMLVAGAPASGVLQAECVDEVMRATTEARLTEIQARCDTLSSVYRAVRLSHAALVAALAAAEAGGDMAVVAARVSEAAAAATELAATLAAMKEKRP